ncbi:hypothetical protein KR018_002041 [Drosophila ironensis]|nr:hypothetical protein KR018_002041 [Drosophila ironensis]
MQHNMVSIPAANMNGGLKAATSGSVVPSAGVLANAPRAFLANATSTFLSGSRQGLVPGTATAAALAATSSGAGAVGTVRYFSQFGKLQKLANGDKIVMANGNVSAITVTKAAAAAAANGSLGNRLIGTTILQAPPETVIIDDEDSQKSSASHASQHLNAELGAQPQSEQQQQQQEGQHQLQAADTESNDEPELDIVINNVVCSFSVRCHLKLREIALNGANVEYRRENGMVTMKLRHPYTTASIWSSGRITCTGATSETMAKVAARRYARCLGKLGFPTRFQNFRIVNVLGTCSMPWAIKIVNFSERHRDNASYEPELHPGVTYKMRDPKATLKIFSTGSITVTAASVNDVESAIQHIYPLVFEFRKQRSAEELQHMRAKQQRNQGGVDATSEIEESIVSENKTEALGNIFVNTVAAHSKPAVPPAPSALTTVALDSAQRLEQFEMYRHLQEKTQDERRHVPFPGEKVIAAAPAPAPPSTATTSSSSTADNICANARRRATECWATKLQNKRPRYNDLVAAAINSAPSATSTSVSSTSSQGAQVMRTTLKAATVAAGNGGKLKPQPHAQIQSQAQAQPQPAGTSGRIPVNQVLRQVTSRARNAQLQQRQHLQNNYSSDYQIDDLIEEEEANELISPY